jgi:predicted  nucleic acid-binding Zn-ribbon protein
METKEQLVNNIKEWIKLDGEISKLRSEIKEKNNKKKTLTNDLVDVMKKNEIDCFDINGGALIYKKNKIKKPINGKTLLTALKTYYKEQPEVAEELNKHIMDSREEQIKETIKRKISLQPLHPLLGKVVTK